MRRFLDLTVLEDRTTPVTVPSGFALSEFVGDLTQPTALQEAPDGRFFITQQQGTLRIASADGATITNALTLTVNSAGERGLLGIALDPNFSTNNFIYLYYTVPASATEVLHNRVSRFTVSGNTVNPSSELILVDLDPLDPGRSNHNGGALHFGNDGKLYVAVGDNATPATAQSSTSLFGKILRYNSDGSIPTDNPATISGIANAPTGKFRAIYAAGLRNPFTFDVDTGSSRIYVNDVGQNTFEEVNDLTAGVNFGWPGTEGDFTQSNFPNFTRPIVDYIHGSGNDKGFAITGGAFYRPVSAQFPAEYDGDYFYADFVNNWIRRYDPTTGQDSLFAFDLDNFSTVDLDAARDGRLLVLARGNGGANDGSVFQISFTSAPQIVTPPADQTRQPGQSVTFSVVASGTAPLSYQWQRNNQNIPGETASTFTLANPQLSDDGATFRVIVTNAAGSVTSSAATLTVTANQPPTPTILTPTAGTSFFAGQTMSFSGSASDPEDGALPASAFSWRVDYITGSAAPRPFFPDTPGIASGSVTIPTRSPFTLPDVAYRFTLTVTDSVGNVRSVSRDIVPQTASVTLTSANPNAAFTLDSAPQTSPLTFVSVVGLERDISAIITINSGSQQFNFSRWSDGVTTASRTVIAPAGGATFTAEYVAVPPPPTTPPPPGPAPAVLVGSGTSSIVRTLTLAAGEEVNRIDLSTLNLDPPFTGEARVARGYINGDLFPDFIVSSGPGTLPRVVILDGQTGSLLSSAVVFESTFTGGVFVAVGDVDADGREEIIVSPDQGGGPRVRVFRNGDFTNVMADFFGIDDPTFRGGARVAAGDMTGDFRADLVVSAGFLGGPRVAGFDGRSVAANAPTRIFNDFFAFEPELRNGTFVTVGDVDADGRSDLVVAAGPGGGPRVQAFAAADLLQNDTLTTLANFFVGNPNGRAGVRVAFDRIPFSTGTNLLVGTAEGVKGEVFVFPRTALTASGTPTPSRTMTAFADDFTGGVYVG